MSKELVGPNENYGFILTEFAGHPERGKMYQISESNRYVQLDSWQMIQLIRAFLKEKQKALIGLKL